MKVRVHAHKRHRNVPTYAVHSGVSMEFEQRVQNCGQIGCMSGFTHYHPPWSVYTQGAVIASLESLTLHHSCISYVICYIFVPNLATP